MLGAPRIKLVVFDAGGDPSEEAEAFLAAGRAARLEAGRRNAHAINGQSEADVAVLVLLAPEFEEELLKAYVQHLPFPFLVKNGSGYVWREGRLGPPPESLDEILLGKWLKSPEEIANPRGAEAPVLHVEAPQRRESLAPPERRRRAGS